jgi:formyltetrahydrofolate deformylase
MAKKTPPRATLLISCQDAPGIVAALAGFVAGHGGNILDSDQHTDPGEGVFFIRLVFELEGFGLTREELKAAVEERLAAFAPHVELRFSDAPLRAAILVSKYDHCLYDLLLRWRAKEILCEFPLVISNHPDLAHVAEHFDVPFKILPITKNTKAQQEAAIHAELEAHDVDLIVLARYMQILSGEFVARYPSRIINIHHSFLPAFKGARPYHQAHRRGVKIIGATSHYVTEELDTGPIIAQDVVQVSHRDTLKDLIHKGRDLEKVVLARAVRWHSEHRVLVYSNKTVVFD